MPGPPWGEDSSADEILVAAHVVTLLRELVGRAPERLGPTVGMAHTWHRAIYRGVGSVPLESYLGAPRGSTPELDGYEVVLLDHRGRLTAQAVPAADVRSALSGFQRSVTAAVAVLDDVIPVGARPRGGDELMAVLRLAAEVHGEWVRIHPHANGNGRVARVWANWLALRFGLPPFVRIKPRPDGLYYAQAAHRSMSRGDHELTAQAFLDLLRAAPGTRGSRELSAPSRTVSP